MLLVDADLGGQLFFQLLLDHILILDLVLADVDTLGQLVLQVLLTLLQVIHLVVQSLDLLVADRYLFHLVTDLLALLLHQLSAALHFLSALLSLLLHTLELAALLPQLVLQLALLLTVLGHLFLSSQDTLLMLVALGTHYL